MGRIALRLEHDPANMRVPEAFCDIVRILLVIDVLVVAAMIRAPAKRRILHRRGTAQQRRHLHGPSDLEGKMRQQSVIPKRDAHARKNV